MPSQTVPVCLEPTNNASTKNLDSSFRSYRLFGKSDKTTRVFQYQSKTLKNDPFSDDCLANSGRYRTCFRRATNLSSCDAFARAKPFLSSDETMASDTMHLTLIQDTIIATCRNLIQVEKALLTFLADNIGSDSTFEPACVFTVEKSHSKQTVPDSDGEFVDVTVLEMELSFIHKNGSRRGLQRKELNRNETLPASFDSKNQSIRLLRTCTRTDKAMCCSQNAINNEVGKYCSNLACDLTRCGGGRRPRRYPRNLSGKSGKGSKSSLYYFGKSRKSSKASSSGKGLFSTKPVQVNTCSWYGLLNRDDFNTVIRRYSEFKSEMTRAILDATDTEAVAKCCANRFSIDKYGTPSLTCDEYDNEDCPNNEDIKGSTTLVGLKPNNGL